MNKLVLFLFVMIVSFSSIAQNNSTDSSVKYFDMGKSIKFCDTEYKFAWSTHPYDFYYLQEYLPDGETFDNYTQMFTVGVIFYGDASYNSEFAIQAKIEELEKRVLRLQSRIKASVQKMHKINEPSHFPAFVL